MLSQIIDTDSALDKITYGDCLFHSIEHDEYEIFRQLITLNFNLNEYHTFKFIPLHHAVDTEANYAHQLGKKPIPLFSKTLLEAGANPYLKDKNGQSAAEIATAYKYQAFLDLLTDRTN